MTSGCILAECPLCNEDVWEDEVEWDDDFGLCHETCLNEKVIWRSRHGSFTLVAVRKPQIKGEKKRFRIHVDQQIHVEGSVLDAVDCVGYHVGFPVDRKELEWQLNELQAGESFKLRDDCIIEYLGEQGNEE